MVNKVMLKHRINHQRYDILICRIVKVSPLNTSRFSQKHIKAVNTRHISNMSPEFISICSYLLPSQTQNIITLHSTDRVTAYGQTIDYTIIIKQNFFYVQCTISKSLPCSIYQQLSLRKEMLFFEA